MICLPGKDAAITESRISPHCLRHTFAVNVLRNGGILLAVQQLMEHADLVVLCPYVTFAEADLARAPRQASPADRMGHTIAAS